MSDSLPSLCYDLMVASNQCTAAGKNGQWAELREAARKALSAASKLHTRAAVMNELAQEAGFAAAEVDRALKRAEQYHQTTVDEQIASAAKTRRPRKPKG